MSGNHRTLPTSATGFGLGALLRRRSNEVDIEQALGLKPKQESPLTARGFGWPAAERSSMEIDPQHAVWLPD
jgi:hypothetical protein